MHKELNCRIDKALRDGKTLTKQQPQKDLTSWLIKVAVSTVMLACMDVNKL